MHSLSSRAFGLVMFAGVVTATQLACGGASTGSPSAHMARPPAAVPSAHAEESEIVEEGPRAIGPRTTARLVVAASDERTALEWNEVEVDDVGEAARVYCESLVEEWLQRRPMRVEAACAEHRDDAVGAEPSRVLLVQEQERTAWNPVEIGGRPDGSFAGSARVRHVVVTADAAACARERIRLASLDAQVDANARELARTFLAEQLARAEAERAARCAERDEVRARCEAEAPGAARGSRAAFERERCRLDVELAERQCLTASTLLEAVAEQRGAETTPEERPARRCVRG